MAIDYVNRIRKLDWPGLQTLWTAYTAKPQRLTEKWLPGKLLEHLVLRAFELDGAAVTYPYSVRLDGEELEQIDGAVHVDGLSGLVECKDTSDPVNVEPIAKLRNQLLRRPALTIGILVSRKGFTLPAQTLAQFLAPQTILLWNGDELDRLLGLPQPQMTRALRLKWRQCVEQGVSDYDIRVDIL